MMIDVRIKWKCPLCTDSILECAFEARPLNKTFIEDCDHWFKAMEQMANRHFALMHKP